MSENTSVMRGDRAFSSHVQGILYPVLAMASAAWSRGAMFIVLGLLAHTLTPDDYGAYTLIQLIAGIVAASVSAGDMWMNRFARHKTHTGTAALTEGIYLLLSISAAAIAVVTGAAAAFNPWIGSYRGALLLGISGGAIAGMTEACFAVLRARNQVATFFLVRDFILWGSFFLILLIARPHHVSDVLAVYAILYAVTFAALLLVARPELLGIPSHFARRRVRVIFAAALRHFLSLQWGNIAGRLAYVDVFVLSVVVPIASIGEYRTAAQIAIGFIVVQHFVFLTLPWQMRALAKLRGRVQGAVNDVATSQRLLLIFSAAAAAILLVCSHPIMALFGERFVGSTWILQTMLAIRFAGLLWGPQHEILVSNGRALQDANANLAILFIWPAIFFSAMAGHQEPIRSAVIATSIASAAAEIVRYKLIQRTHLQAVPGHPFGAYLPIAAYAAAIAFAASH